LIDYVTKNICDYRGLLQLATAINQFVIDHKDHKKIIKMPDIRYKSVYD